MPSWDKVPNWEGWEMKRIHREKEQAIIRVIIR
jgi:hypothetical protein